MQRFVAVLLVVMMLLTMAVTWSGCSEVEPPGDEQEKPIDSEETVEWDQTEDVGIYPIPRSVKTADKEREFDGKVYFDAKLEANAKEKMLDVLGFYKQLEETEKAQATLVMEQDEQLHFDGYSITIDQSGIRIAYKDGPGAYYAAVTMDQLLQRNGLVLPYVQIEDYPDLEMRGFSLDMARDKVPTVETVQSLIDEMAALKMNYLQLFIEFPGTLQCELFQDIQTGQQGLSMEEMAQIAAYARKNYIEIIPFVECMGHLEGLLAYPQYIDLQETFTAGCSTICLQNPAAQELIGQMLDTVIECFDCEWVFIGGDETYELGTGQSLEYLPGASKVDVYLDNLRILYDMCVERNVKMITCHDMLAKYYGPETRSQMKRAFAAMPGVKVYIWEYEEDATFVVNTAMFDKLDVEYILMPSTNVFGSVAGRLSTAEKNMKTGAYVAKESKSMGVMYPTFGDGGNRNTLTAEYNPLAYGAGLSWDYEKNVDKIDEYLVYVNDFIWKEQSGKLLDAWEKMQRYNDITGRSWGAAWLCTISNEIYPGMNNLQTFLDLQGGTDRAVLEKCIQQMDDIIAVSNNMLETLEQIEMPGENGPMYEAEMRISAKMILYLAEDVKMRIQIFGNLASDEELQPKAAEMYRYGLALAEEYRQVWMIGNTYSWVEDSVFWMLGPNRMFLAIGDIYGDLFPATDRSNCFIITPDDLDGLDAKDFSRSYAWFLNGKNYPALCCINGVINYGDFDSMFADKTFCLLDAAAGTAGKIFAVDYKTAREKKHYTVWPGDPSKQTYFMPTVGWPVVLGTSGAYEITCKIKFASGAAVADQISFSGTGMGVGRDIPVADFEVKNLQYSAPDANGWVTVKAEFQNGAGYRFLSLFISPVQSNTDDTMYIADLQMVKA